jgi:hypothetical protein
MRFEILMAVNIKTISSIVQMETAGTFEMPGMNLDPTRVLLYNNHCRLNVTYYVVSGLLVLTVKARVR